MDAIRILSLAAFDQLIESPDWLGAKQVFLGDSNPRRFISNHPITNAIGYFNALIVERRPPSRVESQLASITASTGSIASAMLVRQIISNISELFSVYYYYRMIER